MSNGPVSPFYLQSFIATRPGSNQPVSEFGNGEVIQLSWDSNGTNFQIYCAQDGTPIYTGTATTFTVNGGRTSTTTFILAASVTGGPDSGTPNPSYETIYLYDALTVTISNPDVTPKSVTAGTLTVNGTSTLKGDATLGNATVGGTLTTSGAANLNGSTTLANLTVNGASTLKGDATLGNATVGGTLNATGNANLANAVATRLTVQNAVSMLNARGVNPGNYTASTDGLVVGIVSFPSDPSKKCIARLYGQTSTMTVWATGGNMVSWMDGGSYIRSNNPNSFVLPVQQGQAWNVSVQQSQYNEVSAPTAFYWVPFGKNASLQELSEQEAAALGLTPPEPFQSFASSWPEPDLAISQLLDILSQVTGEQIPTELQDRFARAIRELVIHPD